MRRQSRTFFVYLFLLCLAMACLACNARVRRSGIPSGAQTALDAAIEDIDAGRYDKLYQEASDEWRAAATLEQSIETFKTLHDKLGNVRIRDLQSAHEEQTSTAPIRGHSLVIVYDLTFDRTVGSPPKPIKGMETFTLLEHDGRWYLARYFVTSSELR